MVIKRVVEDETQTHCERRTCSYRRLRRLLAGSGLVLILAATPLVAYAAPEGELPTVGVSGSQATTGAGTVGSAAIGGINDPDKVRSATEAEQRASDISGMREINPNFSDAQAVQYLADASAAMQLDYEIQDQYPAAFARRVTTPGDTYRTTFYLKNPSPELVAKIRGTGLRGVTVESGARFTAIEVQELYRAALGPFENNPAVANLTAAYNWDTNVMDVAFTTKTGIARSTVLATAPKVLTLPAKLVDSVGTAAAPLLTYSVAPDGSPALMSGGTALSTSMNPGPNGHNCTAGFTAYGVNGAGAGKIGIITAEHCGNYENYEGRLWLTKATIYDGTVKADTLFHYTTDSSESIRRDFIYNKDSYGNLLTKPARAKGNVGRGDPICTYGTTTARQRCDSVVDIGRPVKNVDSGITYYNQSIASKAIIRRGDSGGPWFAGNTAAGFSSIFDEENGTFCSFQPWSDAERKTGARIKID